MSLKISKGKKSSRQDVLSASEKERGSTYSKVEVSDRIIMQEYTNLCHVLSLWSEETSELSEMFVSKENVPKLPWDQYAREKMEKRLLHLENYVILFEPAPKTSREPLRSSSSVWSNTLKRHADQMTVWRNVEFKAEKTNLEKKILHFRTENEILSKRYMPVVENNLPETIKELMQSCERLKGKILCELKKYNACDEMHKVHEETMPHIKEEFTDGVGDKKLTSSEIPSNSLLCLQDDKMDYFYDQQQKVLRLLTKYCKLLLREEKFGATFNPSLPPEDATANLNDSLMSENTTSCSFFSSPDRASPRKLAVNVKAYDLKSGELREANTMYGRLVERRVKQSVATGAIQSALSQVRKDLKANAIEVKEIQAQHNDSDVVRDSNVKIVDRPSSLQLRSQILHLRERQSVLRGEVEERLKSLQLLCKAVGNSCNCSHENLSFLVKRDRLQNFVSQQNKILSYLNTVRERGDRTRNILEGEQTGLRKQTLHAEAAFAEVHSLDQFTKQLQEDLKRLNFSGQRRQRLTIAHKDELAQKLLIVFKNAQLRTETCASTLSQASHVKSQKYIAVKEEPLNESTSSCSSIVSKDSSNFGRNLKRDITNSISAAKTVFKHEFGHANSVELLTYDDLLQFVHRLEKDISLRSKEVAAAMRVKRDEIKALEESVTKCEASLSRLKQSQAELSKCKQSFAKDLSHIEMQLGGHMTQWANMQRYWDSNPAAKMERDAFVDFFLRPTQTSLNISRWKKGFSSAVSGSFGC